MSALDNNIAPSLQTKKRKRTGKEREERKKAAIQVSPILLQVRSVTYLCRAGQTGSRSCWKCKQWSWGRLHSARKCTRNCCTSGGCFYRTPGWSIISWCRKSCQTNRKSHYKLDILYPCGIDGPMLAPSSQVSSPCIQTSKNFRNSPSDQENQISSVSLFHSIL